MLDATETRAPTIFASRFVHFFLALFLFIALLNGQHNLTLFAVLLLVILNGADLWSRFSRSKLITASNIDKKQVFPGESIGLDLQVTNKKWLPVWFRIKLPISEALWAPSDEMKFTRQSGLLGFQKVSFAWVLTAQQRGIYAVGPPRMTVGDLMGFYPRECGEGKDIEIIVYPRLIPLRPLPLPKRDFFGVPGSRSPVQDPIYILGTRDYQPGRSSRAIHWKASARRNRIQEKIFEPSQQAKVLILVDVDGYAACRADNDFEQTLEVAASLTMEFDRYNFALGFATNGKVKGGRASIVPLAQGPRQSARILETLAGLTMQPVEDINSSIKNGSLLRAGVSCVGFALEENERSQQNMIDLNRKHIPTIALFNWKKKCRTKDRFSRLYTAYALDEICITGDRLR